MITLYQKNRKKLINRLKDGLIIVNAPQETIRNNDVAYKFRQNSYFLYLTGITKPEHTLILDPKTKKSHLFIPDIDEKHRLWVGRQLSKTEAKKVYHINHVHYMSELPKILTRLAKKYKQAYLLPKNPLSTKTFPKRLKKDHTVLAKTLDDLRLIKEPEEIKFIQKANKISHQAYVKAIKATKPNMTENQIQAVLESEFLSAGAPHVAFNTIVAAGKNASILHYVDNNAICRKNDLVLIDGGCEWMGYASDISRTFPVSKKFSKKQKEIYQIVLNTKKECIRMVKPNISMLDIHIHASKAILTGLIKLGLIKKHDLDILYEKEIHRVFFPHGIGHLLGLDVHDVGGRPDKRLKKKAKNLRNYLKLEKGMVITIEPGIYFIEAIFDSKKKRRQFDKYVNWKKADQYRSVGGVRIEDDILVTKNGHKNLTTLPDDLRFIENKA